ncbi:hypothetical protein FBEOM_3047 [Fusarium beomiforme]|uniref:JmjC domain-containing protein n=1 Tax=Fusarium beomiforme TaxID=44412 RepID=A0A9P5DZC6_9HYPO|nr:hypothetical protein FBEOM_3047 [Fusarium beomiforme]
MTTKNDLILATVEQLMSDVTTFQTELEKIPMPRSTRSRKPGQEENQLQTVLSKFTDLRDIIQTLHLQAKEAQTESHIVSNIAAGPNQQTMDRDMNDTEMITHSENAGSQEEIPRQSPSHVPSPAQDSQPNVSENRSMGGNITADSLATTNDEDSEGLDDSMTDTQVDTTANRQPQEAASPEHQPAEGASMDDVPRVDDGPAIVEVSRDAEHASAACRHRQTQRIIATEMEEESREVNQTNDATEGPLLRDPPSQDGQKDQTCNAPSDLQTQPSGDQSIPQTLDNVPARADGNPAQPTATQGSAETEDTQMTDAEPEMRQRAAMLAPVALVNGIRPATPCIPRPENNAEVARHSKWSSQSSDTSGTISPTCSTASGTGSVSTRHTTPDSTSMREQANELATSDRMTSVFERYFIDSEDTPTLNPDQLGRNMPKTLSELSETTNYAHKVRLPWIVEAVLPDIKTELKQEGDADVQFNIFEKKDENGIIVSRDDPVKGRKFEWPDFEKRGSPMTARNAYLELERFLANPMEAVSYYCGLMKSSLWDLCPLYSGDQLDIKEITRVNEPYTHLGKKYSATAMHKEDDKCGSVNVGFLGTKLFLRVLTEDTEKFEGWVRANYKCKPCPQFVRHLNIFFKPKQLEAAGIRFELLIQRPGDLIETKPHQYHQVLNLEDSLAISINFLPPGVTPNFKDANNPLKVCNECGFKRLCGLPGFHVKWVDPDMPAPGTNEAISSIKRRKRKAPPEPLEAGARNTRGYTDSSETFSKTVKMIESEAPFFKLVSQPSLDEQHVMKMAAAILSIPAIDQFKGLVSAWRNRNEHITISPEGDALKQCALYLKNASSKSAIGKFHLRHSRALLARLVDNWKSEQSYTRLGKKEKADLARKLEMDDNELTNSLREGRMWNEVCGDFHGLLPFIPLNFGPPFNLSVQDWKQLGKSQVKTLHQLIDCDDTRRLCKAGQTFENIVARGQHVVFEWEQKNLDSQSLWGVVECTVAD